MSEQKGKVPAFAGETIDTAANRNRVWEVLNQHVGAANAVSMTELYELVFDRPWDDHVNSTRALRSLITAMRDDGLAICSITSRDGGGYYQPAAGSEMIDYLRKMERRALCILKRNSRMKKISLPDYLGQLKLDMEKTDDQAA
ncbi:putative cytosolic protein [Smithella sp. ME-1]|uniref:Uncharacterized protein n=1 Tax=hydrocarbon metagenome TaxID=938273 RepID=A0A0W8FPS9_9ZZZZ|nr:putative cytosolic protein [Smithella sp. ME-1]